MKITTVLRRFLIPAPITSLVCLVRHGARVSPKAEVELSGTLRLGRGATISSFCKVKSSGGLLVIGENTHIAAGCFVATGPGGLQIGADGLLGANCALIATNYSYARLDIPTRLQDGASLGIRIGRNVQLGSNCVVLDGAKIGDNCIIAAGSVVSGYIPENSIASGNPAKVIFKRR